MDEAHKDTASVMIKDVEHLLSSGCSVKFSVGEGGVFKVHVAVPESRLGVYGRGVSIEAAFSDAINLLTRYQYEYTHALKQTGRTTRMLKAAYEAAQTGVPVYVIISVDQRDDVRALMRKHDLIHHKIHFETEHTLTQYDWRTGKLSNAHPDAVVLVDHAVIEQRYHHIFKELHRFDR